MSPPLRIATRKSPLALWQAKFVASLIQKQRPELTIELLPLVTSGDTFLKGKLQSLGGKGLFVKELEEALLDKRADIAVHSMKDVPALLPEGLTISTIAKRANPLDALVSPYPGLQELPPKSRVGTASLRRQSQWLALYPDCIVSPLRGNLATRLQKLDKGEYDAIILAAAGLERLGLQARISAMLTEEQMLPACGQGTLGVEYRSLDERIQTLVIALQDPHTEICLQAERRVNAVLGGNCHLPLAVYARISDHTFTLQAKVLTPDGGSCLFEKQSGSITEALSLADLTAHNLLAKGATKLLKSA